MGETNEAPQPQEPSAEQSDQKTDTDTAKVAAPAKAGAEAAKSAVAEPPRKFKLKINGTERELDENSIRALAQKGLAADEKFQDAAKNRKMIEQLARKAKEDPDALLRELTGRDPEDIYKEKLGEKLRRMTMDPRELELEDYKSKIAAFEKEKAERVELEKQATLKKTTDFFVKKYDQEIPAAIKAAGLPLTEDVIRYTADIMLANIEEGTDLPYEIVMELVKDRYSRGLKQFLSAAEKDKLVDLLGEDMVDALIAAKAKKAAKAAVPSKKAQAVAPKEEPTNKYMTPDELKEYVKKWSQG